MSMNGPWANGDRIAFMRIHWSFPPTYPYALDIPTFELERNPTVSPITRQKIIATIKEMRSDNRQCLVATSSFLLGSQERVGRRLVEEESDSESEKDVNLVNVPMLIRTCGATFGPNGQSMEKTVLQIRLMLFQASWSASFPSRRCCPASERSPGRLRSRETSGLRWRKQCPCCLASRTRGSETSFA